MYYFDNILDLFDKNTAFVGGKNSGKTTILKEIIKYCYEKGFTILLFDSTTNRSILNNTKKKYKSNIVISSPKKENISFDFMDVGLFPHNIIRKTDYLIYSFDVSKYLEESNRIDDPQQKKAISVYYKQLVVQELVVMLYHVAKKKCIVIMDEIEFIPIMQSIITRCNLLNFPVIATMKNTNSLSNSIHFFDVVSLD